MAQVRGRPENSREPEREIEALRERFSALSAAILRISESLDLDTVLSEAIDSARALTGARYGIIATVDEAGQPQDFVTSGIDAGKLQELADWPDGLPQLEHLRGLSSTLKLSDLPGYVRTLGFSGDLIPSETFLGTPIRHRGVHIGSFSLGGKEREFTSEDEEMLLLFAAPAAAAIANARTYRDERRARADLEALVDTSPVGVVVFDAGTGSPVSLNREAKRIVEGLHIPGRSLEQFLEVATFRRADGRETTLEDLRSAEAVRAEEIEISVPDGRSVTTLINASPIRSEDGTVISVVVTMQDLAALEEVDHLRAEFLGMVSHELRAPLTSIKGSTTTVLSAWPRIDPAEMREFFRIIDEQADQMRGLIGDLLDAGRINTGTLSVTSEPMEVADLVEQARTAFLGGGGRQAIVVDLAPDLPRVMADSRRIVQVLNNLFSNASRHSQAFSPIRVGAARAGVHVEISVSDEGEGVPPERLPRLFRRYPDADGWRDGTGGSGLGLAICKGLVEAHGGRIRAERGEMDRGIRFVFTLPATESSGNDLTAGVQRSGSPADQGARNNSPILVVDDDPQTLRHVRNALEAAGYAVLTTGDAGELPRLLKTERPQLVLLDLILPGTDGIELMDSVPGLSDLPVIFISGYGRDETIAAALERGAADYIVKPFSSTELAARVAAALRRLAGPERFLFKDLAIDYERRLVTVAGRPVEMTATEYELLRLLSINAGRVMTYESLLRQIWGGRGEVDAARIRTFVKKLRGKLGDQATRPNYILTERAVGYRMARPEG